MISSGLELLEEEKVVSMAGITSYFEGDWVSGSKFTPAKDAPDESENIKQAIETTLENINSGGRFSVGFFTETAAHLKQLAEDDDERLLPTP